jgi:hypothetical protein
MRVAACLVTRGNVPMDDILESIPDDWEVVLWDNSKREDLGVYGRYQAIELTDAELIYVQDDDAVLERESILELASYLTVPGTVLPDTLVANMPDRFRPHYPDSCLVGFGAIFERHLPRTAFNRLGAAPANFELTCDVYFTALTSSRLQLDLSYRDQSWASDPDRMWKQTNHVPVRTEALALARMLR